VTVEDVTNFVDDGIDVVGLSFDARFELHKGDLLELIKTNQKANGSQTV
jgi:hypothetical protein